MEYWRTVSEPEEESSSFSDAELSSSRSFAIASSAMSCDCVKPSICDVTSLAKSVTECSAGIVGGAIVGQWRRNFETRTLLYPTRLQQSLGKISKKTKEQRRRGLAKVKEWGLNDMELAGSSSH
jgi:hypothetical protein